MKGEENGDRREGETEEGRIDEGKGETTNKTGWTDGRG